MTPDGAIAALLAARRDGATICPSEAARLVAGDGGDWRAAMPAVHSAVGKLAARQAERVSWKGAPASVGGGPYRLGRGVIGA